MSDKMLLALFLLLLFGFMSFLMPNVLYPDIAESKGMGLGMIGLIFSLFPVGACATSVHLGKKMNSLGRKRTMRQGGQVLSLTMILFAISEYIGNYSLFALIGAISRVLQGVAVTMIGILFN